jgi:hypothetical protein
METVNDPLCVKVNVEKREHQYSQFANPRF